MFRDLVGWAIFTVAIASIGAVWYDWWKGYDRRNMAMARCILDHQKKTVEDQMRICSVEWSTYVEEEE